MDDRVALTIAGSDSSGGAGIQADIKTFFAHRVFAATAITAITVQNTTRVHDIVPLDPRVVTAQATAVIDDIELSAVKTGMLATPEIVSAVADLARRGLLPNLVVDPILFSSTGQPLIADGGVQAYRELLIPFTKLLTPNIVEAALLTGRPPEQLSSIEEIDKAGRALLELGAEHVVVTGGPISNRSTNSSIGPDVASKDSMDLLLSRDTSTVFSATRIQTLNDHGTGCAFSAAITANLANAMPVKEAVGHAKEFVRAALRSSRSRRIGSGRGPLDYFVEFESDMRNL